MLKAGTKIAYLSAVTPSDAQKEELMDSKDVVDFIMKPFDITRLAERIIDLTK